MTDRQKLIRDSITRMVAHLAREHQTDQTTIWKEMYETAKQQTA